jgi:hypothetical protein
MEGRKNLEDISVDGKTCWLDSVGYIMGMAFIDSPRDSGDSEKISWLFNDAVSILSVLTASDDRMDSEWLNGKYFEVVVAA